MTSPDDQPVAWIPDGCTGYSGTPADRQALTDWFTDHGPAVAEYTVPTPAGEIADGDTTSSSSPARWCANCGHSDVDHDGDLLDPDEPRGQRACGVGGCDCGREPWRSLPPRFGDR